MIHIPLSAVTLKHSVTSKLYSIFAITALLYILRLQLQCFFSTQNWQLRCRYKCSKLLICLCV